MFHSDEIAKVSGLLTIGLLGDCKNFTHLEIVMSRGRNHARTGTKCADSIPRQKRRLLRIGPQRRWASLARAPFFAADVERHATLFEVAHDHLTLLAAGDRHRGGFLPGGWKSEGAHHGPLHVG